MEPILIESLSYSGGAQSNALLEMVLRGEIEKPENFVVINADPGMEDERSYQFIASAKARCKSDGIPFITATGPNLFQELIALKNSGRKRMDLPPYWTRNRETGKKGRLMQKCTRQFKISPMRRALRAWIREKFGPISTRKIAVRAWIGFALDESHRISPSNVKYITHRFPLIEKQMDRAKVEGYYLKNSIPKPPRSVCCACFANGLKYFEDMYFHRPDDWEKAVAVDDSVRDLRNIGIKDEVFVSASLVPLRDLPDKNFLMGTQEGKQLQCNSGVCFL